MAFVSKPELLFSDSEVIIINYCCGCVLVQLKVFYAYLIVKIGVGSIRCSAHVVLAGRDCSSDNYDLMT